MNLEHSLSYVTHHSEAIIQWLFFSILAMSGYLIARGLFGKKSEAPSTATAGAAIALEGGEDIQTFLKKILDQTTKLESMPIDKMTPAVAGEVDIQVQQLKKELQSREEEIGKLKASGEQKPSADADALGVRIKELEAKLAEYEILEDDIADLSLYKEENARLRIEMEKIKGGAAPASEPTAESLEAVSVSVSPGEDIVAEFAQAVNQEPAPAVAPAQTLPDTGDPMADFESAMAIEKKMGGAPEAPVPTPTPEPLPIAESMAPTAPAPKPAAAPVAAETPAPAASAAPSEGDDLFGEFASAPAETEGSLDTDKMMAEMAALVSVEPSAGGSALEEGIDTEKMALEATTLTNKA